MRLAEKKSERDSCGSETQSVEEQTRPSFVQVDTGCRKENSLPFLMMYWNDLLWCKFPCNTLHLPWDWNIFRRVTRAASRSSVRSSEWGFRRNSLRGRPWRNSWKNCEEVVEKLWRNCRETVEKLWSGEAVEQLWKSCGETAKMPLRSCEESVS